MIFILGFITGAVVVGTIEVIIFIWFISRMEDLEIRNRL